MGFTSTERGFCRTFIVETTWSHSSGTGLMDASTVSNSTIGRLGRVRGRNVTIVMYLYAKSR